MVVVSLEKMYTVLYFYFHLRRPKSWQETVRLSKDSLSYSAPSNYSISIKLLSQWESSLAAKQLEPHTEAGAKSTEDYISRQNGLLRK